MKLWLLLAEEIPDAGTLQKGVAELLVLCLDRIMIMVASNLSLEFVT